jgi:hypothetical protein
MAVTDPADWVAIENAIYTWLVRSTSVAADRVRIQTPRDDGEARGPASKATIQLLSLVPLSQQMITPFRQTMIQRYTVTAIGPGEVGVDFYAGDSLVPQRISIMAAEDDPTDVSAAALLAQLILDLPAGYSAEIDPEDEDSILVTGDTATPVFASAPADVAFMEITTVMPAVVNFLLVQHLATWRISFRASAVSGFGVARNDMSKALLYRKTHLDPAMYRLGFQPAGEPFTESNIPTDRAESLAVLDIAAIGLLTGAVAVQIMRAAGLILEAA